MSSPTVNLDAVPSIAGRVTLFGASHDVRDLDGDDYRALNGGPLDIIGMYDLVAKLLPSLPAEQVNRLTGKQVALIIQIADGRIKSVEDQFPNDSGPDAPSPTAPPA